MNRRVTIAVLGALCAGASIGAFAQMPGKVRRVAYLGSTTADADRPRFDEFRRSMSTVGYIEGQNLIIDSRYEELDPARLAELTAELVRLHPDVIVTVATPATAAAKNATRRIPIVFSGVGDPIAFGFVDSLRRPGGNVTGIANLAARHRMPAIYARSTFAEAGGLMSYGSSLATDGGVMARLTIPSSLLQRADRLIE